MSVLRRIIRKKNGAKETVHLGALAKNVTQDATHRFVSDTEKQTWNGKANPGDIPSGAAADYGVANNDTTNRSDMLVTAQVAYQHGKEIDQLNSDLGGCRFGYTEDGLPGYKKEGADTVYPFLSTYEALIPVLTSPSENVIASDNNTSYPPWFAFTNTGRYIADATSDAYLGYAFSKPVIVKGVVFMGDTNYPGFCSTAELQASDDGSDWHTVSIVNGGAKTLSKPEYAFFQESESHKFWRVKNTGAAYRMGVYTMQFLGITT